MRFFIILLLFFTIFVPLHAEEQGSETLKAPQEQELKYVDISSVTKESAALFATLSKIEESLQESEEIKEMQSSLKPYCDSIDMLLNSPSYKNREHATVRELQKMYGEITIQLKQLHEWDSLITVNVERYDKNNERLKEYLKVWGKTYDNAFSEQTPEEFRKHIIDVLDAIAKEQQSIKKRYDRALNNSQIVTSKILELEALRVDIKEKETIATNRIFYQNSTPLFQTPPSEDFSIQNYFSSIKKSLFEKYIESKDYIQTNTEYWIEFFSISSLTLVFVFFYNSLNRKKKLFVSELSKGRKVFFFIQRPFSTYVLLLMLILVYTFPNRVPGMTELILLFLLVPTSKVLGTVLEKKETNYLYGAFTLYLLNTLNINAVGFEYEERVVMLIINFALLLFVGLTLKKRLLASIATPFLAKVGRVLLSVFLLLLLIAMGANIYGSLLLSSRVIHGVLSVIYISALFYTFYIILTGYIVILLRRRISTSSNMLDKYSEKIENTTSFLIKVWMLVWWVIIATKLLSIYPYLVHFYEIFMGLSWQIADITISVASILNFIFIVIGTWALARLTKTALEVEVFSRYTLPRGAPTAILTTTNYAIIISGSIIAFSSLGITPQQFALLFGALGVGIGFGLRNIIANFVSGIIMVFERPIQIGDTIEVDKTTGKVQSIGARSSTIKTFDGSEVIIPNADFIAKEIINWTLSDEQRRKTVEFKVDLDNDIDAILDIMKEVALQHKDVLKDPQPLAVLKGFGEYYLEFKLYFWLSDNLIPAHSEVTLGVYRALQEAGVKMPVPKTYIGKHLT
jgi:small-conductance mechanosensitive channel